MSWFKKRKQKKDEFSSFDDCLWFLIECDEEQFENVIRWVIRERRGKKNVPNK